MKLNKIVIPIMFPLGMLIGAVFLLIINPYDDIKESPENIKRIYIDLKNEVVLEYCMLFHYNKIQESASILRNNSEKHFCSNLPINDVIDLTTTLK